MISSSKRKTIFSIAVVIIIIIGLFVAWDFTADDSYISFRYAENLAAGHGLTYNPNDGNPVEGYTNFLWVMIMVVPHLLGMNPVILSKILGVMLFLCLISAMFLFITYRTGSRMWGYFTIVPFLLLPSTYFHTVSGMETILYCFLILLLFISGYEVLWRKVDSPLGLLITIPFLVLLAGLTRPEGLLPGTCVLILTYFSTKGKSRNKFLWATFAILVAPGLIYFLWRYLYFGWLLPNTFYVKFGQPFDGIEWFSRSISSLVGFIVITILAHIILARQKRNNLLALLLYIIFLIAAILPYLMSNLMMNYMNRFLFHVLPVIFVILVLSLYKIGEIVPKEYIKRLGVKVIFLLVICICIFPLLHKDKTELAHMALYEAHLKNAHIALANALKQSEINQDLRSLAVGDAGAIPYYSKWTSYDFVGLNDEFAAHNPRRKTQYFRDKKPSILILYATNPNEISSYQFGLQADSMLPDYNKIAFIQWFPNYYLAVFIRQDLDAMTYNILKGSIERVAKDATVRNGAADNRVGFIKHLKKRLGF